ncbi:MAG TPA: TIGR04282 family arsenosugar biosynthesis glycosyltransferase [Pyrinomonadaceae bacterium]|jgi:rSAM/selenodomain-associated transferase 1|nr:TIGR04282 family arsenosugar biosynthesis glycosyltransferase [Pyrinomonadaceae bacterium]
MPRTAYTRLDPSFPRARAGGRCALAVLTKAPRAGESKTRLAPPLTREEAAALSACFLRDTAASVADACAALGGAAQGVAVYTPVGAEDSFDGLLPEGFALLAQRGENFGERLWNAARDLFAFGFSSVCLIDSDSPTLPTRALVAAAEELKRVGERVVLGAADDGGYYLIGIKAARPRLFQEIDWSTGRVAAQTVARAVECCLPVALLPAWYDVDDAGTLARLCEELLGEPRETTAPPPAATPRGDHAANFRAYDAPHTRDFLARLVAREGRARIWRAASSPGDRARTAGEPA